jgi:hypothetical protein
MNAIFHPRAGGQHQDRQLRLVRAQVPQQGNTVELREIQVENEEVIIQFGRHERTLFALQRHIHRVMFRLQTLTNVGRKCRVIFNHENAHTSDPDSCCWLLRMTWRG